MFIFVTIHKSLKDFKCQPNTLNVLVNKNICLYGIFLVILNYVNVTMIKLFNILRKFNKYIKLKYM